GLRSLAAVELRTSTSQLSALPIFSQVGFMERLRYFMFVDLKFEGKPGQKIIARSQYIGLNRLQIWLEDAATGERISQDARY
ncbi:hypothetical protein KDX38_28415, partial [Pseudomonas sp. CDFA 602]|uniref:hypothetical protein n=1 Tax=Pseudomonas californiensis TaxID=2829823 RepID=UPI001E42FC0D